MSLHRISARNWTNRPLLRLKLKLHTEHLAQDGQILLAREPRVKSLASLLPDVAELDRGEPAKSPIVHCVVSLKHASVDRDTGREIGMVLTLLVMERAPRLETSTTSPRSRVEPRASFWSSPPSLEQIHGESLLVNTSLSFSSRRLGRRTLRPNFSTKASFSVPDSRQRA